MAIYVYPARFIEEKNGYSVIFDDFERTSYGCSTCGDDLSDALIMAEDLLPQVLCDMELDGAEIPKASRLQDFNLCENEFVNYIKADTSEYRRKYMNNKAVKKTLTIPQWMNEKAVELDINFSQLLQKALLDEFDIN